MRNYITAIFLVCGILIQPVTSSSKSQRLTSYQSGVSIQVSQDDWGEGRRVDIQKVLESAVGELWKYFPNKRLNSIIVVHDERTPRTRCKKGANGEHIVQLTAKDRRWARFAFQFGHELFHVLSNYERDCVDDLRIENEWFEETLAEVSSMFVLRRMAITWRSNPPYPNWRSYAAALDEYAQDLINESHRQLPRGKTFDEWFRENHHLLRGDPYLREKNELVANRLLPLFERNPESWEAIGYLNMGTPDDSNSFQSCLNNWHRHVPRKHERFVEEVARVFGMRITTS